MKEVTFSDILNEFKNKMSNIDVIDFRPCEPPYFEYYIPYAIIIWLKGGGTVIYIAEHSK